MRVHALNMDWSPLPDNLLSAMPKIVATVAVWEPTKYRSGQRLRGVEGDCIGYSCGMLDDVDGRQRAQSPLLPPDSALHDPEKAREAVQTIRRLYAPAEMVLPDPSTGRIKAQPFDIVAISLGAGGPGHVLLVGPEKNTLLHCSIGTGGASKHGWGLTTGSHRVFALYRLGDRERWLA